MINANLEQFLDTGWFNEATLFYNGHTYWCEGFCEEGKDKPMHFFVYRYKSKIFIDDNGKTWIKRVIENGDVADYSVAFDIRGQTEDEVKEQFLKTKIFDGKSFCEIEKEIAWYDETD